MATSITFPVSLPAPVTSLGTVQWETQNGTAVAGTHYVQSGGTLQFLAGEQNKVIVVPLLDPRPVDDIFFTVRLFNAQGGLTLGDAEATAIIRGSGVPSGGGGGGGNETLQVVEARLVAETPINVATADRPSIDFTTTNYGDRILLTAQTDPVDNGLWIIRAPGSGGWHRDPLMDADADLGFLIWAVRVTSGGQNIGRTYLLVSEGNLQIGVSPLVWERSGLITASAPIQVTGNHISIPKAHNGTDGLLSKEDFNYFNKKANREDANTWPQQQRFGTRASFETDLVLKGNVGGSDFYGQLSFGSRTTINPADPRWISNFTGFVIPKVAVAEVTVAVLGAEPVMSDGTPGSGFVGKMGFHGKTPVDAPTLPADATDLASCIALVNAIKALLVNNGLGN